MLEDKEDLAMYISWTEEMLEDAEDKLRGPQGEGEGDIEYDDYHYCCRCSQFTKLTHKGRPGYVGQLTKPSQQNTIDLLYIDIDFDYFYNL